jgi:hypothetical protein
MALLGAGGRPAPSGSSGSALPSAPSGSAFLGAHASPAGSPLAGLTEGPTASLATLTPAPTATRTAIPGPSSPPTPRPTATPAPPPAGLPAFRHIYLIVLENKEYGSIVGNGTAPFIIGLIAHYGLATAYDAVAHPSEPNYLALFSGSTQGVTDDAVHNLGGTNLADQLEGHGRSWRVFAQNVPLGCDSGSVASDGEDGAGTYARKHEPAISFTDISGKPGRCARISDLSHFDPAAADFELIVPNMCNDMHDCSVATGDAFLASFVPRITASPAFADSVVFITWDEGSSSLGRGGHVATLVVSPRVKPGTRSATPHNHYSLLRTIEDAWGLGCLNLACGANDMAEFFAT